MSCWYLQATDEKTAVRSRNLRKATNYRCQLLVTKLHNAPCTLAPDSANARFDLTYGLGNQKNRNHFYSQQPSVTSNRREAERHEVNIKLFSNWSLVKLSRHERTETAQIK